MTCVHLRQLYQLCQDHELKLGGSDLIRVVCHQCGEQEVCPSTLVDMDENNSDESQSTVESSEEPSGDSAS